MMKWSTHFLTTENRDPIYLIHAWQPLFSSLANLSRSEPSVVLRISCDGEVRRFFSRKKILASVFSRDFISYWKKWKKSWWKKKRLLPYLVFRDTCNNTRGHVVIVILSLLGICKAPKFSMGFLGVSFTYWFRGFFGLSLQARSIFFVVFVYVPIRTSPSRKYPLPEGGGAAKQDETPPSPRLFVLAFLFCSLFPRPESLFRGYILLCPIPHGRHFSFDYHYLRVPEIRLTGRPRPVNISGYFQRQGGANGSLSGDSFRLAF